VIDSENSAGRPDVVTAHPRTIGWIGTTALAMGGSNQSLFLLAALFVGQGSIPGQGSAAVPLLAAGLLLSWAAAPGWTELIMMWPNRVGGISGACSEAFRPYNPVLSALTGFCYWWGWVPTCGLTAIMSASAIQQWYLPGVRLEVLASGIVAFFAIVNLCGIRWTVRLATPIAAMSAGLAFVSAITPVYSGRVDWVQASTFHLNVPFSGWFGSVTSLMAGLYLIGFAAPAFEAASCHVGETINPNRNVPRAMLASALMAAVYFIILPTVWLGALGPEPLGRNLALVLGPTFAPLFGSSAKAAAISFMMFNMFHGTMQPLAGAARTLSQLADDGLLPRALNLRAPTDTPWVATLSTAGMAIWFLWLGDPIWLIAAANFTYLIGICMPSVAVWLLRRDAPDMPRPYRAPRGTIIAGLCAAAGWTISAMLGFEQFGISTVMIGLAMAYSGVALYAWRKISDRRRAGLPGVKSTLHLKLTGAMLTVLVLDGAGYLLAVTSLPPSDNALVDGLQDIFVAVAMLTISVGLILPGIIARSAIEVRDAARRLSSGVLKDFSTAMAALGRGDLDSARTSVKIVPIKIHSRDELGDMVESFNLLQNEVGKAERGLHNAREALRTTRAQLSAAYADLEVKVEERTLRLQQQILAREHTERVLRKSEERLREADRHKDEFIATLAHELRNPLVPIRIGLATIQQLGDMPGTVAEVCGMMERQLSHMVRLIDDLLDVSRITTGTIQLRRQPFSLEALLNVAVEAHQAQIDAGRMEFSLDLPGEDVVLDVDPTRFVQVISNLLDNALKYTDPGGQVRIAAKLAHDSERAMLVLKLSDSGVGITAALLPEIFEPFTRGDVEARHTRGLGIGLALTRRLIEMHGGSIDAHSKGSNMGSEFTIRLPIVADSPAVDSVQPCPKVTKINRRITLIDDDADVAKSIERFISTLGGEPQVAHNGEDGLALMRDCCPDVVLLDIGMPKMDGFATCRRIRDEFGSGVFVVAMTGWGREADKQAALRAGFDAHLTKPPEPEELIRLLLAPRSVGVDAGAL
jgi:two-component system, sensor histidine kinase